jgi:hypothetical protein
MLPRAATEFYALQQRVNAATAVEIGRLWRQMGDDLDASFVRLLVPMLAVLVEAQERVTRAASDYVPSLLDEARIPDRPTGDFRPDSLVGMASDGRPLASLAYGAVTTTKEAIGNGASTGAALEQGGNWLALMAKLQVADAARQAVGVMTASRKNLAGNVRVLNPPSCQRCAILAGRFYRWSKGFDRHPRCDCTMAPVPSGAYAEAEGFIQSPMDAYRNGEIRDLTKAQRFAIDNGADISQVVNATRGMSTTATQRVLSRRAARVANRNTGGATQILPGHPDLLGGLRFNRPTEAPTYLTPEGIYQLAAGDRDEAIRLLRHWGYLD